MCNVGETMRGMNFAQIISGARPRTLALSIAAVVTGVAAGMRGMLDRGEQVNARFIIIALLCALVAIFLQIAVNYADDYADGVRGTDAHRGVQAAEFDDDEIPDYEQLHAPVRLVASGVNPRVVLNAAIVSVIIACICGIAVIVLSGFWWGILVGVLCVTAGWFYVGSPIAYGYHGWGELAAFLFFGPVAVLGTAHVLGASLNWLLVAVSVGMGLISLAVLSVNNLRDITTDERSGKRTWAVRLGSRATQVCIIVIMTVLAIACIAAWIMLSMHNGMLAHESVALDFCAVLGFVCVILFAWLISFNVVKGEYMRAMMSLSLLAIAFAIGMGAYIIAI